MVYLGFLIATYYLLTKQTLTKIMINFMLAIVFWLSVHCLSCEIHTLYISVISYVIVHEWYPLTVFILLITLT